jgi:glutamine synthetase
MGKREIQSTRDVMKLIRDQDVRFVDLKFVDLFGTLQHITIPVEAVDEEGLGFGFGFDGSSVRGFQAINEADMLLRPDPSSAFIDPFFDAKTVSLFGDVIDPLEYKPYLRDPRGVAQRAERLVRSLGIADQAFFGPEVEFFVFDEVRFDQNTQHGFYFVNSESAFWNTGGGEPGPAEGNLGHRLPRKRGYFAAPPGDRYANLRSKMSEVLRTVGVQTELHHHEVGAPGQNEIGFRFGTLTDQADRVVKYKYVVKNTARRLGKSVTFMPKPLFEEAGSGMHVNLSLWKGGENLFYEHGRYGDLSETAVHFIGGLLAHAPALCALTNPATNSYRRLVPGYEAPINLVYSCRNRSACVRVPMATASPRAKRVEYRTPDPSCNPYLGFAAVLLAGIDGIVRRIQPDDPVDENIYELAGTDRGRRMGITPGSLEKAIDALESDHEFLLRDGVFTREIIDVWIRTKREQEIDYISLRPHPSEFSLYFDV